MEQTIQAQWAMVRNLRDTLLSESDYFIVRAYESGLPIPADIVSYRQSLRDIPQTFDDPADVVWPQLSM